MMKSSLDYPKTTSDWPFVMNLQNTISISPLLPKMLGLRHILITPSFRIMATRGCTVPEARRIFTLKGLKKSQKILDYMGSTERATNLFRATQMEEKLRRYKVSGKQKANQTHFEVGKKVRETIAELGGHYA